MVLSINENNSFSEYYRKKTLEYLLFQPNIREGLSSYFELYYKENIYTEEMLDFFHRYFQKQIISPLIYANMLSLLKVYRDKADKYPQSVKIRWIKKINEIIVMLNQSEDVSLKTFITIQNKNRFRALSDRLILLHSDDTLFDFYKNAISYDLDLLYLFSENVSFEDFQMYLANYLIYYDALDSIESFIYENPDLFSDSEFLTRVQYMLRNNRNLYRKLECIYELDEDDKTVLKSPFFALNNWYVEKMVSRIKMKKS